MKTLSSFIFLAVSGWVSFSWALTDIEISGEVSLAAQVYQLPTGQRGDSAFLVPSFVLGIEAPLKEGNLLVASFEGAEKRQSSTQEFDVYSRTVYLDVVSIFQGSQALRLGLVPRTWLASQYEDWSYRFLGETGKAMTEKYRYSSLADLGVVYMSQFSGQWGEWAFSLTNGEGAEKAETGPHKDFGFFWRSLLDSPWTFALSYTRGSYEGMDDSFSTKERIQGMVTYHKEDQWMVGLEVLDTHDPAEAVRDLKMAGEVDVTNWLGQSIHGRGASLFTEVSTGPLAKVMARYDFLQPAEGLSNKSMSSAFVGLSYQVTEDIRSAVVFDYSKYDDGYGLGVRDQSKLEFATQVLF